MVGKRTHRCGHGLLIRDFDQLRLGYAGRDLRAGFVGAQLRNNYRRPLGSVGWPQQQVPLYADGTQTARKNSCSFRNALFGEVKSPKLGFLKPRFHMPSILACAVLILPSRSSFYAQWERIPAEARETDHHVGGTPLKQLISTPTTGQRSRIDRARTNRRFLQLTPPRTSLGPRRTG